MITLDNKKNQSSFSLFWNPSKTPTKNKPHPKVIQSTYLNVPGQLQVSWLEHIHQKRLAATKQSHTPFSAFDQEQRLLEGLFNSRKDFPEADKKKILDLCSMLRIKTTKESQAENSNAGNIDLLIDIAKQQVAQIIFLADIDINKTASLIDLNNIPQSLTRIQKQFELKIQNNIASINNQKIRHDKVPIQDSALVVSVLKPLAIASMLVTSAGLLNLGLIDSIKKYFFDFSTDLVQYEKELLQTLDDIEHSSILQQQIEKVSKPISPELASNDLIRISLHLPTTATPTDAQAKIVVLAALLSDMRQGDVGSCFGTSVAIMMMGSLKGRVISDVEQLITQGRIVRKNSNGQTDFIPVLDIGDSTLETAIPINKDGLVLLEKSTGYLWESPGIIAACKQLNIPDDKIQNVIQSIISAYYASEKIDPKKSSEISPQTIIKYLVEGISSGKNYNSQQIRELNNIASFAFSSETNTPLLRAWESCIASMAESKTHDYVRHKILNCVTTALDFVWPKNSLYCLTEQAKKVQNIFQNTLNSSIQLRYDPKVEIKAKDTGDGHSKMLGAFVLHELDHGTRSITAKPVLNPTQFKNFVIKKLNVSKESIEKSADNDLNKCQAIVQNIQTFLAKPDSNFSSFLKEAIRSYEDENKKIKDPLKVWEEIEHLPFRDATGDENVAVYSTATGINPGNPETYRPKDASSLLKSFILFGRSRAKADKFLEDNNPYQRYMVDTPQHAFTLTPEDSSIVGAMSSPQPPKQWIEEHVIKPGNAVANIPISQEQKNLLINAVCTDMVPKERVASFKKNIASISDSTNTIHLYANEVLNILLKTTRRKNAKTRAAFSRQLTNIILEKVLPPNASKLLEKTAARIADTNWVDQGVRHIYFSCFFDPLTKSLQLGTQDEDGSHLQAVDQEEWVVYVPWEMYGVKLTPSLDNRDIQPMDIG